MAGARVRQIVNSATVSSNAFPATNASWSPGATAGNLMILAVELYGTTAITVTTPSGWTLANAGTGANTARVYSGIFYRVATGTSADTITSITTSGALSGRYSIEEWSGLATKSVLNVATPAVGSYVTVAATGTITVGTPTPTVANTLTYAMIGQRVSAAPTAASYTWTSGYTASTTALATGQNNFGTAYKNNTTSGSQGAFTVAFSFTGASNTVAETVYTIFNQSSTPVANFTGVQSGATYTVDASSSSSTYTQVATYAWNWGDGTTSSATSVAATSHTYTTSGSYTVTLTVTDDKGQQATKALTATVNIDLQGWISDASGIYPGRLFYWDGTAQRALGLSGTVPTNQFYDQRSGLFYASYFSGATGASIPSEWVVTAGATGSLARINAGRMQLQTAASPYASGPSAYLDGVLGIDDFEVTFDMALNDLTEQYPVFAFRLTNNQVYDSGAGAGMPKTGYALVFGPGGGIVDIQNGLIADNNNAMAQFNYTFPSASLRARVNATQRTLKVKLWSSNVAEPTAWTYQGDVLQYQVSGKFMFLAGAGGSGAAANVLIDNFQVRSTRRHLALLNTQPAPVGNLTNFRQIFYENFDTPATANGPMASTYANSWQPLPDGTGGVYYSGTQVSAHDGVFDCRLDGANGTSGSFGTPSNAFNRVGGKFSIRAKAIGGDSNIGTIRLWPANGNWDEGELDYPEARYEQTPFVNHHVMNQGDNSAKAVTDTTTSWRDWHIYSIEWIPGTSVSYYLDGALLTTITANVPTTAHQYMFQTGNYGSPGNFYIDWVSIWAYDTTVTGASVTYGAGTYGQGTYG
jgi:PKD repeat protein